MGWFVLGKAVIGGGALVVCASHPFLALHHPVEAGLLVVEGWIPDYAVEAAAAVFKQGKYHRIVTVGGPVTGMRSPAKNDDTHAYIAATAIRADCGVCDFALKENGSSQPIMDPQDSPKDRR